MTMMWGTVQHQKSAQDDSPIYDRTNALSAIACATTLNELRDVAALFLGCLSSDTKSNKVEAEMLASAIVQREQEILFP